MIRRMRAQSTMEYMVLVIVIAGAFLAMQQYIKRGFQGRWKSTVDDFGEQYDPRTANSIMNYTVVSNSSSVVQAMLGQDAAGVKGTYTNRIDKSHSVENKSGTSTIGGYQER